jgi:hypothetical protein
MSRDDKKAKVGGPASPRKKGHGKSKCSLELELASHRIIDHQDSGANKKKRSKSGLDDPKKASVKKKESTPQIKMSDPFRPGLVLFLFCKMDTISFSFIFLTNIIQL